MDDLIEISCPTCGKNLHVPAERAGDTGRCPSCREPIEIDPLAGLVEFAPGTETEPVAPSAPPPPPPRLAPAARPAAAPAAGRPRPRARGPRPRRPRRRGDATAVIAVAGIAAVLLAAVVVVVLGQKDGTPEEEEAPRSPLLTGDPGSLDPGPTGPAPGVPVRATFAAVAAGNHEEGTLVEFPAIVLPIALLRLDAEGGRPVRYYTLAVRADSGFFQRLRRLEKQIAEFEPRLREMAESPANRELFLATSGTFVDLEGEIKDGLRLPMSDDAIAVRLQSFDRIASRTSWEDVGWRMPGAERLERERAKLDLLFGKAKEVEKILAGGGITLAEARTEIRDLLRRRPPELERDLPTVEHLRPILASDREAVRKFNEVVRLYNSELLRRREFIGLLYREALISWRATLARLLALRERPLVAVVESDFGPGPSFTRMGHNAPRAHVAERMPETETFATRHYSRTDVLLTSYPGNARVAVDGKPLGTTPLLLSGRKVGREIEVRMELEKHTTDEATLATELTPEGVQVIRRVLRPE